jgi:asparagine synthase (glutamine-hydrolysing)
MSAICGIFYQSGEAVTSAKLGKMIQSMRHRGPDRSGSFIHGSIGLGHAMLCTTPESVGESQPFTEDETTIVADARIDNRDELLEKLGLPESSTDIEIILSSYHNWKENCPVELLGDFSFAVWDERIGRIFCARDHMGVKPFYYYQSDKIFAFASEIKALLQLPEVPRVLNEEMVANYLATVLDDREITFYKGIKRLPAAHSMTFPGRPVRYWRLDPASKTKCGSDQEYAAQFLKVFNEAVRCRTRCAFPVGSTLSGGLDSSSVCSLASQALSEQGKHLETFSAIFPDAPKCDETPYIKEVLSIGNMNPHFIRADRVSPLEEIDKIFDELDQPFWIPNLFWNRAICQEAGRVGVRVLLDGFDGDTVISHGFFLLEEMFKSFRWRSLLDEFNGLHKTFKSPTKQLIWNWCIAPLAPFWFANRWKSLRKHTEYDHSRIYFNPDFAEEIGLKHKLEIRNESQRASRDYMLEALEDGLLQYLMEAIDHIASAFSVECSHPFFDKRVVEFSLSLPSDQRLRLGYSRWIMREALKGILPEMIRMRTNKANLSSNFDQRLLSSDEDALRNLATDDHHPIWRYADIIEFRKRFDRAKSDPSNRDLMFLWAEANLANWLIWFGSLEN